ncbi:MAG: hypothetical protein AB9897_06445 [Anaerolineaceae bacterium]
MVAPNPNSAEEIRKKINDLRYKLDNLHDNASLKSAIDQFTSLDSQVNNFQIRINSLRQRKYAFNGLLENNAEDLENRWVAQKSSVQAQISMQATRLQANLQSFVIRLSSFGTFASLPVLQTIESEISQFENQCSSTADAVEAMFGGIERDASKFNTEITELEFSMDQADLASFPFLPNEAVVKVVKATWCKNGKEEKSDPEGFLFLTDMRLIFEQNEEVATKKVLFVTTETKKIQQTLFEVPTASIEEARGSNQGLFKNIDMLELNFAPGCFSNKATLHLFNQDSEDWQVLIVQVKTHEIDKIRVIAVDQEEVEKVKSAPTQCPKCGGAITKPVLRGMDTITCEFCGAIIRL